MLDGLGRVMWRWVWIGLIAACLSTIGSALPVGRATGSSLETVQPSQVLAWVHFSDSNQLTWLANSVDIWEVDHARQQALVYLTANQAQALRQAGFTLAIDLKRTQAIKPPSANSPDQIAGITNFPCYRTVEETYQSIQSMVDHYPALAQSVVFGQSWDKVNHAGAGGSDLIVLKLTNRSKPGPKPVLLVIAAIHAREYTTAELATRFAETLLQAYGTDPTVTWLLDDTEIDVIPQANPDGRKIAEGGVEWRKNRDNLNFCGTGWFGVDLNRNFDSKWGGASRNPCDEDFQGPSSASEPETQALQAYIAGLFPARRGPNDSDPAPSDYAGLFISLHSFGKNVLFPWGWTALPSPNQSQLNLLGQKFGFFNHYTVCQSNTCLYPTTGTTDEWAYASLGVPGYTFELGTSFFESCDQFEQLVLPDNMEALMYAAKTARLPYQLPAGPDTLTPAVDSLDGVTLNAVADDTRFAGAVSGQHTPIAIQASRYSIDTPAWTGGSSGLMAPVDGAFDQPVEPVAARIDLTGLDAGRHTVYIDSQDTAGQWGVAGATFLDAEYSLRAPSDNPQFCMASENLLGLQSSAARNFITPISLSLSGLPQGMVASFSLNPVDPGLSIGLDLTADGTTLPGVYPVTILGESGAVKRSVTLQVGVAQSLPGSIALVAPADGAALLLRRPEFKWQSVTSPATYELQIALDVDFKQIVLDRTGLTGAAFVAPNDLSTGKRFYWRVRVANPCGVGPFSPPASVTVDDLFWLPFLAQK